MATYPIAIELHFERQAFSFLPFWSPKSSYTASEPVFPPTACSMDAHGYPAPPSAQ